MDASRCDEKYAELKSLCETPLPKSDAPSAFDWTALLTLIPVVLSLFIKDVDLSARLIKLVELIRELFSRD